MGQHHGHNHNHSELDGHACPSAGASQTRLLWSAVITGVFIIAEVVGGVVSGSLALLADAGHMLTDFAALMAAWISFKLAARPATDAYPNGFARLPTLTAFGSSLSLILIGIWILIEAAIRLMSPAPVLATPMLIVAVLGLLINAVVFWVLTRGDRDNLNMRAAILHVAGDLLGSVAAIIAALVILQTGWQSIDPILSALVAVFIMVTALPIIKQSAKQLLRGP